MIGVIPRAQVAGYTWATVGGDNGMSIFNDIAVFVDMAHYIAVIDVIGWIVL